MDFLTVAPTAGACLARYLPIGNVLTLLLCKNKKSINVIKILHEKFYLNISNSSHFLPPNPIAAMPIPAKITAEL